MHGSFRLTPEILLKAYSEGIFPMAERRDSAHLYWLSPEERGIIPLRGFHVPRRLARLVRSDHFDIRFDTAFGPVMRACAAAAPGREDTWINAEILSLYTALYERGHAHSVECWRGEKLAGGLYGVSLGAAFFGESMFSTERDASKVALVHLVGRLIEGGYTLLDSQFLTTHLAQFGAYAVPRDDYLERLERALEKNARFYCPDPAGNSGSPSAGAASGETGLTGTVDATGGPFSPGRFVLQLITQTS